MHKRLVFNIISRIVFFVSLVMLIPLLWAWLDNPTHREVCAFMLTIMGGLLVAFFFQWCCPLSEADFHKVNAKDGLAIVGLSWLALSALGALPLFLSEVVTTYTDAFFEIVSGFTTTGASIFSDIESLPRGILFWRSLTHWLGGMGIIVLYIALLPALGSNAFQIYKAEAPGLTVERVEPRLKETAKNLWTIYFSLSFLETILLMLGGMSVFDALCHTFGTMATGGFSTQNASVGAYSPYIQWVIIVFMFLAGVNFILHYQAFKGRFMPIWKDEEFRVYSLGILLLLPLFVFLMPAGLAQAERWRQSLFQIVSIVTTTGYSTADFDAWPTLLRFILVLLMFVGGCGASTGGGMKMIRAILSVKIGLRSIVQSLFPNAIMPIKFNKTPISEKLVAGVMAYFVIFIFLFFLGALGLLVLEGCDMTTALTASISALSNIGPGLGGVGATQNFSWISIPGKWVLIFLMLAGRLELYSILILFLPITWKK